MRAWLRMPRSSRRAIPGHVVRHITSPARGRITRAAQFIDMFADALKVPRVRRHVPYPLAYAGGFLLEIVFRLLMRERPPRVTRYGAWLLGRHLEYSTEKARSQLGWQPAIGYGPSIERTLKWFLDQASAGAGACLPANSAFVEEGAESADANLEGNTRTAWCVCRWGAWRLTRRRGRGLCRALDGEHAPETDVGPNNAFRTGWLLAEETTTRFLTLP